MIGKRNEPKPKEFSITDIELSELSFYAMNAKKCQMEAEFWLSVIDRKHKKIEENLALDRTKVAIDWNQVFLTGKVLSMELPKSEVQVEQVSDHEQELQQKPK